MRIALFILITLFYCSCGRQTGQKSSPRIITDALERKVYLPDTVKRIVCIRASAIRLVTYAGGAPLICGVEEPETRTNEFTHTFAYPELARKSIIGPGMGGDPELIMSARPDVIFMSSTTAGDADELQRHTGIPVFTIEYGDIGSKRPVFYKSLRQISEVLRTKARTDSLIQYIDNQIQDLKSRVSGLDHSSKVYVGGISYKGQKGITSTDPYYAAFNFLDMNNVASQIDSAYVSAITGTYIDWEQLIDWNPDIIFVDRGGLPLVNEEFKTRKGVNQLLNAYHDKKIYTLWPYNNNHTNFEVMLANAWYVGKVLYPKQFDDISMQDKVNEITTHFVGKPIFSDLVTCWGNYQNIFEPTGEE